MAYNFGIGGPTDYLPMSMQSLLYNSSKGMDPYTAEASRRGMSVQQLLGELKASELNGQGLWNPGNVRQAQSAYQKPAHLQQPAPGTPIGGKITMGVDTPMKTTLPYMRSSGGGGESAAPWMGGPTPTIDGINQMLSGGSSGGYFGGSTGAPSGIGDLINQQRAENANSRDLVERNWQEGKNLLLSLMGQYQSDPMNVGSRRLAQGLLNNPEAINDQTQSLIRNQLMNQLGAQAEATRRQQTSALASRGQLNPAAMARMNTSLNAQEDAALSRAMAGTEIQRALQRNQDITNASQLGRTLGMDKAGIGMGIANSYLENMPQYLPEDLSGLAALLFGQQNNNGGGSSGAFNLGYSGGGSGRGQQNDTPAFGFNLGALNPWGQQSPGQTGFAPGLNGAYQWTGQPSYGGANAGLRPAVDVYNPNNYFSSQGNPQMQADVQSTMNFDPNAFYSSLGKQPEPITMTTPAWAGRIFGWES